MKNYFTLSVLLLCGLFFTTCKVAGKSSSNLSSDDALVLKEGTYTIRDLHLEKYAGSRLVIRGEGNVILTSDNNQGILLDNINTSSLILQNLHFKNIRYAVSYNQPASNKDSLSIDNCSFEGCEAALYVKNNQYGINNLIITNSVVSGAGTKELKSSQKGFFAFCPVKNALIQKNTLSDLKGAGGTLRAIHIGVIGGTANNYEIAQNTITNVTGGNPGEVQGIMVLGEGRAYIHHNILKHIYHTIPGTNDVEGIYSKCLNTEIAFNNLEDVGDTEASIAVKGTQETDDAKTSIHDNTIYFAPNRDPARKTAAIRSVKTKNLEIRSNIIDGAQSPNGAINIKSDLNDDKIDHVIIQDNKLSNCLGSGIRITGAAYMNVSITHNTITTANNITLQGKSYGIELQVLKDKNAEQPLDVKVQNNTINSSRNNFSGVYLSRQTKSRNKENTASINNIVKNTDAIIFSSKPVITNNKISVAQKPVVVDNQLNVTVEQRNN